MKNRMSPAQQVGHGGSLVIIHEAHERFSPVLVMLTSSDLLIYPNISI